MTNKKLYILLAILLTIIVLQTTLGRRNHGLCVSVIESGEGWGYDILKNNRTIIHQPYVPAVSGQYPFKSKKLARKTGRIVLNKLRQHQSPVVTVQEVYLILR
ncbi:MAG: DUF4907 domain-containing protein [Bacteroidales bacterium]|nr:DUF4907 domain-containing protein [Bacteroidales bacterium]